MNTPDQKSSSLRITRLPFGKLNRDVSLVFTLALMVITGSLVYFVFPKPGKIVFGHAQSADCDQRINEVRLKDYRFTQPLMFADIPDENPELNSLKEKINSIISISRSGNTASNVSVYFRRLNDGSWFVINGGQAYTPASLMKIAFLIATLKQAGTEPTFLNKKIYFEKHFEDGFDQNIKNFVLKENKFYTVNELLYDMIVYSDNDALTLIANNTDGVIFNKVFSDLGLTPPPITKEGAGKYVITVTDFCKLFRILYSSGYLTDENSELTLSLLSKSSYKEGFLKNIMPDFPVAHKFGERVIPGGSAQLHEIGIFYEHNEPYLLGVMTEGGNLKDLSNVLSEVSQAVYSTYHKAN